MSDKIKFDKTKKGSFVVGKKGLAICAACKREKSGPGWIHDCDEKQDEANKKAYFSGNYELEE